MYDDFEMEDDAAYRIVATWIQASHAACRMLVEEPALAGAITVVWSLAGSGDAERRQASDLAQRLGEEYCLRATVTEHDAHFSVRFVRVGGPVSLSTTDWRAGPAEYDSGGASHSKVSHLIRRSVRRIR